MLVKLALLLVALRRQGANAFRIGSRCQRPIDDAVLAQVLVAMVMVMIVIVVMMMVVTDVAVGMAMDKA